MSNLIITIIAIALGAAVVLASMYSGGAAMTQGAAKSMATAALNQAQQISGAATMWTNENGGATLTSLTSLTTAPNQFLKAIPAVPTTLDPAGTHAWAIAATGVARITTPVASTEICQQIEKQRTGVATIPSADPGAPFSCYGPVLGPYTLDFTL